RQCQVMIELALQPGFAQRIVQKRQAQQRQHHSGGQGGAALLLAAYGLASGDLRLLGDKAVAAQGTNDAAQRAPVFARIRVVLRRAAGTCGFLLPLLYKNVLAQVRSEERRVGEECSAGWGAD